MKGKTRKLKQFLTLLLACMMVVTTIPTTGMSVYATEVDSITTDETEVSTEMALIEDEVPLEETAIEDAVEDVNEIKIAEEDNSVDAIEEEIVETIEEEAQEAEAEAVAEAFGTVKWEETAMGILDFSLGGVNDYECELVIDCDGKILVDENYSLQGGPGSDGVIHGGGGYQEYFTETGIYTATLKYKGKVLATDSIEYTMPKERLEKPSNFVWTKGDDGFPTKVSWDIVEDAVKYRYKVGNAHSSFSGVVDSNSYIFEEYTKDVFENNQIWYIKVTALPRSIIEKAASETVESKVEVGDTSWIPKAPVKFGLDKSGSLEFVSGDEREFVYDFELKLDGKPLRSSQRTVGGNATAPALPFGYLFTRSGQYELTCRAITDNGFFEIAKTTIDYKQPETTLGPIEARLDGTKLSWNAVPNAFYYTVVMVYAADYGRMNTIEFPQRDETSVNVDTMLTLGNNKSDVRFYVEAIPNDLNEYAISSSNLVTYDKDIVTYRMECSPNELIVGDAYVGRTRVKVFNNKGAAVAVTSFESEDESVCTVDKYGNVIAIGSGTTGIIATFKVGTQPKKMRTMVTVKTAAESKGVSGSISWDENDFGMLKFTLHGPIEEETSVYNIYVERDGAMVLDKRYFGKEVDDDITMSFDAKEIFTKAGTYKAVLCYYNDIIAESSFDYACSGTKLATPANVKWVVGDDGYPTQVTWDPVEGAAKYKVWVSSTACSSHSSEVENNYYSVQDWDRNRLGNNHKWSIKVLAIPEDFSKNAISAWSDMVEVTVGDVEWLPKAPTTFGLDSEGGLLFTSGDEKPYTYNIQLTRDGIDVHQISIDVEGLGEANKIPFGFCFTTSGEYELICRVNENGYVEVARTAIDYNLPSKSLEKVDVELEGTKLTWSEVDNAAYYTVMMEYTMNGVKATSKFPLGYNVHETDISNMLLSFGGKTNIGFYVLAVPKDIKEYAPSKSETVPYEGVVKGYFFEGLLRQMVVDDPEIGKTKVQVVDETGKVIAATYESSDKSVITVDAKGNITAVGEGYAVVNATYSTPNGKATLPGLVQVKKYVNSIEFIDGYDESIYPGDEDTIKLAIVPADVETEYEVESSSDNVTVVASGTATGSDIIKVQVKDDITLTGTENVTITAKVTTPLGKVYTAVKNYKLCPKYVVNKPENLYFYSFATIDKTLSGVAANSSIGLPDGWKWVEPDKDITRYNGLGEFEFAIVNENPHTSEKYYSTATVYFGGYDIYLNDMKYDKMSIGDTINIGTDCVVDFDWLEDFESVRNLKKELVVKSDKPNIVDATIDEEGSIVLEAKSKGRAIITYYVVDVNSNIIASDTYKFTTDVVEGERAEIAYEIIDDEHKSVEYDGLYYTIEKGKHYFINNTTDDFAVSYVSSDAAVAKLTNGAKAEKDTSIALESLKTGYAVITATASDAAKTTRKIYIKTVDKSVDSIVLLNNVITLDTGKSYCADQFNFFDSVEREIKEAKLFDAAGNDVSSDFDISPNNTSINIIPFDRTSFKTGKLKLTITLDDEETNKTFDVTIKKVTTKPNIITKQIAIADTMVAGSRSAFEVYSTSGVVTNVTIDGVGYEYSDGILYIDGTAPKQVELDVIVAGYLVNPKKISIKTSKSAFVPSKTSGTIYTDVEDSYLDIAILNKATKKPLVLEDEDKVEISSDSYDATIKNGNIVLSVKEGATPNASEKITFTCTSERLNVPVSFNVTVKAASIANAKLTLANTNVVLYNYTNYQTVLTGTTLTLAGASGCEEWFDKIQISEIVNAKQGASLNKTLSVDIVDGSVVVQRVSNNLKAGTYSFEFKIADSALKSPIKAVLKVKVVNIDENTTKSSVTVNVGAKNNIDVLNRTNTFITLNPKFTNIAGNITELVGVQGKDADMFEIVDNNIALKQTANVLEKETYVINAVYDVMINDSEKMQVVSPNINVKFKLKKPTIKVTTYSQVVCALWDEVYFDTAINASGKPVGVDDIELTNLQTDFFEGEHGPLREDGTVRMSMVYTPSGLTKRGKTYKLTFNVYPTGMPKDSKPYKISVPVKIAK